MKLIRNVMRFLAVGAMIWALPACATPIDLLAAGVVWNTGYDSAGLLAAAGAADAHYLLTSNPDVFTEALATDDRVGGFWADDVPESTASKWISPTNPASVGGLPGVYEYQLLFNLTGYDPSTVTLAGRWSADNKAEMFANGTSVPGAIIGEPDPIGYAFLSWHNFTVDNSLLSAGSNTLTFVVINTGAPFINPTGLRLEFTQATADQVVPEPSTFVLIGLGLAAAGLFRRKRAHLS